MSTKYTKGPWEVFEGGNFVRVGAVGYIEQAERTGYLGGPLFVAEANYHATEGHEPDHQKAVAIGHLIAAAPELLDALRDIAAQLNGLEGRQYRWIRERALAAISKAESE